MPNFIEFSYKENGGEFYVNSEYVTNVQPWGEDATMICLMPHLEMEPDVNSPPPLPFIAIVEGNMTDVIEKLRA